MVFPDDLILTHILTQLHRKLDDASRSVFKENVRLNEALNYYIKEVEDLRKKAATSQATMLRDKVRRERRAEQLKRCDYGMDRGRSSPKKPFFFFSYKLVKNAKIAQ